MDFPTIHTNFWDAVIAVPCVMVITQLLKVFLKVPRKWIPTVATIIGLAISIFISHRNDLLAGVFMGWFYGAAAIGSYASLKTMILAIRKKVIMTSLSHQFLVVFLCNLVDMTRSLKR